MEDTWRTNNWRPTTFLVEDAATLAIAAKNEQFETLISEHLEDEAKAFEDEALYELSDQEDIQENKLIAGQLRFQKDLLVEKLRGASP